jgi:branched-chain amino acid transport system substrate-binding protein
MATRPIIILVDFNFTKEEKQVTRKVLFSLVALTLVALVALPLFAACARQPEAPPTKDKIVIGIATSLTGPLAVIRSAGFQPIYEMWVDDVNADGGIYVAEYGKKLPIQMLVYDDKGDVGTMTKLTEKLILEDKVDFLFSACGTGFLFAQAPIANKYGYILIGEEGGSKSLFEMGGLPYFFSTLNTDIQQMPVLAEIFAECGVKTAYITFLEDLHGVEYSGTAVTDFALKGIDVVAVKSLPWGLADFSPTVLAAQASGADAFCSFAYPDQVMPITGTSMALGYNPKAYFLSVGPYGFFFKDAFGTAGVEGVMGCGAWNEKCSPAAKEFSEKYTARFHTAANYWGGTIFYASLQILQQAIEKAGTLDQKKIADIMHTEKFNTVLGPTWFDGIFYALECYPGQIGQWQKGVFEVIDPGAKRTAAPEYPKPAWPAPPK